MRGNLQVSVEHAQDLLIPEVSPKDLKRNLFVSVSIKDETKRTSNVDHTKTPVWDEKMTFSIDVLEDDKVHFVIHSASTEDDTLVGKRVATIVEVLSGSLNKGPMQIFTVNQEVAGYLSVNCIWSDALFDLHPKSTEETESDVIGRALLKLTGPRPKILRIDSYYCAAKHVYCTLAGLPLINIFSPIFENIVESVLEKTPLKETPEKPEEGAESIRVVESVDRRIGGALSGVDNLVDKKKDEALRGMCDMKNAIKGIKPKDKNIFEATVDGIGYGAGAAKDLVGKTVHNTVCGVQDIVGSLFGKVSETTNTAVNAVKSTTYSVTENAKQKAHDVANVAGGVASSAAHTVKSTADSVKQTAGSAIDTVKTTAGSTVETVKNTASSAAVAVREKAGSFSGQEKSPAKAINPTSA